MMRRILAARLGPRRDGGVALVMVIGVRGPRAAARSPPSPTRMGSPRKARTDQDWNAAWRRPTRQSRSTRAGSPTTPATSSTATRRDVRAGERVTCRPARSANPAFGLGPAGRGRTSPAPAVRRSSATRSTTRSTTRRDAATALHRPRRRRDAVARRRPPAARLHRLPLLHQLRDHRPGDLRRDRTCEIDRYARSQLHDPPPSGCGAINFRAGDVIDGPLHTNDAFQIDGAPSSKGWTTTSYNPATGLNYSGHRHAVVPGDAGRRARCTGTILAMPATNTQMKKETRPDLPLDVPRPGCLYTGPTKIVFKANGKMTVTSPWTKVTSPVRPARNNAPGAGLPARRGPRLEPPARRSKHRTTTSCSSRTCRRTSTDPNYWATGTRPARRCAWPRATRRPGTNSGTRASRQPGGLPRRGRVRRRPPASTAAATGTSSSRATSTPRPRSRRENYIYVTGDTTYARRQTTTSSASSARTRSGCGTRRSRSHRGRDDATLSRRVLSAPSVRLQAHLEHAVPVRRPHVLRVGQRTDRDTDHQIARSCRSRTRSWCRTTTAAPPRHPDRQRCHRPEVPWHGRHGSGGGVSHRVPQGLQVRQAVRLRRAAQVPLARSRPPTG